jgi:hypothetical protein
MRGSERWIGQLTKPVSRTGRVEREGSTLSRGDVSRWLMMSKVEKKLETHGGRGILNHLPRTLGPAA